MFPSFGKLPVRTIANISAAVSLISKKVHQIIMASILILVKKKQNKTSIYHPSDVCLNPDPELAQFYK